MVFTIIVIVAIIAAVLLGLVVLVQNPKGGGLSGSFGGAANQIFGYKRSTDDIEKVTWGLVAIVFALCLGAAAMKPTEEQPAGNNIMTPEAKQPTNTMSMPQQSQPTDNATTGTVTDQPQGDGAATDPNK